MKNDDSEKNIHILRDSSLKILIISTLDLLYKIFSKCLIFLPKVVQFFNLQIIFESPLQMFLLPSI